VGAEEVQDSSAEGCDDPADPQGPAIVASLGDEDADNHGRGSNSQCLWEHGKGGADGGVELDSLVVET
jgi:hypothetical protein